MVCSILTISNLFLAAQQTKNKLSTTAGYEMKISIVIPTRERAVFLQHSLATALSIPNPDVEILVSDNASTDGTSSFLASISDPRLKVVRTNRRVSMRQNFEHALTHSSGDYVVFIGDDDGILPRQFNHLCDLLQKFRPDSLSYPWVQYVWPQDGITGRSGTLRIERRKSFGSPRQVDLDFLRKRLLYAKPKLSGDMPGIYHGVASRDFLEGLKTKEFPIFGGRIPDSYISFLSTLKGGNHLHVPQYFSINGASSASNGASHGSHASNQKWTPPASTFISEAMSDPIDDVVYFGIGVPQALFSTLETVRVRNGLTSFVPDYCAWYALIAKNIQYSSQNERSEAMNRLIDYAKKSNTLPALERGLKGTPLSSRFKLFKASGLLERLSRSAENLWSFRVSVPSSTGRTIKDACHLMDEILGSEALKIENGSITARDAWRAIATRGERYKIGW
jgi:glycosyltransferase involved in cell wall biosynthesis